MPTVYFSPLSGSTTSDVRKAPDGMRGRPFVLVPSMSTGSGFLTMQTAASSAGPWATITKEDGSGAAFVVTSGAPSAGLGPRIGGDFLRLQFSVAVSDSTSIKVAWVLAER